MRIVVTGGTGKAGRWVVADLRAHGHDVLQRRQPPRRAPARAVAHRRPRGLRPGGRGGRGRRRRRPPRGDPRPGDPPAGRDVPDQRPLDLQRVRGRRGALVSGAWSGRRARPCSACRSTRRRRSRRSTRRSSRARERRTRSRSSSARRWRPSSAGGRGIPIVGLRISNIMEPDDYAAFPPTGPTRGSAAGTCGATSTAATSPRRAAAPSRRT